MDLGSPLQVVQNVSVMTGSLPGTELKSRSRGTRENIHQHDFSKSGTGQRLRLMDQRTVKGQLTYLRTLKLTSVVGWKPVGSK